MNFTKLLLLVSFCFSVFWAKAQDTDYRLTENIFTVRGGYTWLTDEYLSALPYSGYSLNLKNEWWRQLGSESNNWIQRAELQLTGAWLYSSAYSNLIMAGASNFNWGAYYKYDVVNNLTLLGGGYANVDFLAKYIVSSVNKPYSMDLAANLNFSAGAAYYFSASKGQYRLRYLISTPFVGCMFVPEMGATYYELLFSLDNTIHASSFHNKLGLKHELTFDMRFKTSTWRIGVEHEFLKYNANMLNFSREQFSIVIGTVFDARVFGGTKRPDNAKAIW